jgi:hypothetical protein
VYAKNTPKSIKEIIRINSSLSTFLHQRAN